MRNRAQHWFRAVPIDDPIDRHLAVITRMMLIGLGMTVILSSLLYLLHAQRLEDVVRPVAIGGLILVFVGIALVILRRGQLAIAGLVATTGLLLALAFNFNGLGFQFGEGLVITFLLPIALAGFLSGRSGMVVTIILSLILMTSTAIAERYAPGMAGFVTAERLPASVSIMTFALVTGLLGVFIDLFGRALRQALAASICRERELELRTAELSKAKQQLEAELAVRMSAEAALAHERDLLHALMDNIPDTIYFKDAESRFTRINRAQAQLLGIDTTDAAVGKTDHDFQPIELAQGALAEEQHIVATGQPLIDRLEFNPTADGKPRWLSTTKMPIKNDIGQVIGIVGMSRDITVRQEIDRLKSEFITTVSHELRTPLTSIRGSLGLLAGGAAGDISHAAKKMVDIAYKNSERLTRLVNDILDIERIEGGKLAFQMISLDLTQLVEHALEANSGYGEQFGITFALTGIVPGAYVQGDADRLTQVLTNLLSNAAKFSPAGGTVEVAVTRQDRQLCVSVSDHGPGVPAAFRARIFGKFAQADSSTSRQNGGVGLGLSIAKAIIERHGGRIDYTSEPGQGATFFVDLPAAE
ncbi:MAG: ATP-binding protein [Roseiflexaceae bacterium]